MFVLTARCFASLNMTYDVDDVTIYVILNAVKNLSVSANVESPYSLRDVSLRST